MRFTSIIVFGVWTLIQQGCSGSRGNQSPEVSSKKPDASDGGGRPSSGGDGDGDEDDVGPIDNGPNPPKGNGTQDALAI